MAPRSAPNTQVVQTAGDLHDSIRQSVHCVAKLVFGNATDLDPSDRVFHANPNPGQLAIVAFLTRRQFAFLRLFFGCKL